MTNYRGLNSLLVRALTALDEARDIIRHAQRANRGTQHPYLLNYIWNAEDHLDSACDEVTRARTNLTRAEQAEGRGDE